MNIGQVSLLRRINNDIKGLCESFLVSQRDTYKMKYDKINSILELEKDIEDEINKEYNNLFRVEDMSKYNDKQLEQLRKKTIDNIMKSPKNTLETIKNQYLTKYTNSVKNIDVIKYLSNFVKIVNFSICPQFFLLQLFNLDKYFDKMEEETNKENEKINAENEQLKKENKKQKELHKLYFPVNITSKKTIVEEDKQCLTREQWKKMWKDVIVPVGILLDDNYPYRPPQLIVYGTNPRFDAYCKDNPNGLMKLCIDGISSWHVNNFQASEDILSMTQKFIDYTVLLKMSYRYEDNTYNETYGVGEHHNNSIEDIVKHYNNKEVVYSDISIDGKIDLKAKYYTKAFTEKQDGLFISTDYCEV